MGELVVLIVVVALILIMLSALCIIAGNCIAKKGHDSVSRHLPYEDRVAYQPTRWFWPSCALVVIFSFVDAAITLLSLAV